VGEMFLKMRKKKELLRNGKGNIGRKKG